MKGVNKFTQEIAQSEGEGYIIAWPGVYGINFICRCDLYENEADAFQNDFCGDNQHMQQILRLPRGRNSCHSSRQPNLTHSPPPQDKCSGDDGIYAFDE